MDKEAVGIHKLFLHPEHCVTLQVTIKDNLGFICSGESIEKAFAGSEAIG